MKPQPDLPYWRVRRKSGEPLCLFADYPPAAKYAANFAKSRGEPCIIEECRIIWRSYVEENER